MCADGFFCDFGCIFFVGFVPFGTEINYIIVNWWFGAGWCFGIRIGGPPLSFNPSNSPLSIADENYATLQAHQGSLIVEGAIETPDAKDWSAEGTIRRFVD